MNRKRITLLLVAGTLLLASALLTGKAHAADSCFSDTSGHWAETFICWLKDNDLASGYPDGTFRPNNQITRAEVAVLLNKQVQLPPAGELITIGVGSGAWQPFDPETNFIFEPLNFQLFITKGSVGNVRIYLSPSIPTILYGKVTELKGFEFCYETGDSNFINTVHLTVLEQDNNPDSYTSPVIDATDRSDTACRYYALDTPLRLSRDHAMTLLLDLSINNTITGIRIGRTTFFLNSTNTGDFILPFGKQDSDVLP